MRTLLLLTLCAASIGCADRDDVLPEKNESPPAQVDAGTPAADEGWRVVAVNDASNPNVPDDASSHVIFESGDTLVIPLMNVEILSTIHAGSGAPWLVASGVECSYCDAPAMIVFLRAARGHADKPLHAYAFPGDQLEGGVEDGKVLGRTRMFLGTCLDGGPGAVVQDERPDSSGTWSSSGRMIMLSPAFVDSTFGWTPSIEKRIADSVRSGACKELPGRKQYVL